jgi:magnesium transporter
LDTSLGERFLVTIHPSEEAATGMVSEIDETLDRLAGDRIRPAKPVDLLHAIVSLIALRQRLVVQDVARRVSDVEAQVLGRAMSDPQASLEEMFMVRYELLSVRTAAAHSEDVMARARRLEAVTSKSSDHSLGDLQDMFRRVHRMTDSEQELLNGVIDLYRTSTDTKMMIATERLAVLAAVTLPVTAIASVYGMNVIVYPHSQIIQLIVVLAVMAVISLWLLRWARRQGWW